MAEMIVKKRKNSNTNVKNDYNLGQYNKKYAENCNLPIKDYELFSYIKTLLLIRRFLPNIISLLSKLVVDYASDSYRGSFIFGDAQNGTYGQVDEILKIEERQQSLLNIQYMIDAMTKSLDKKYYDFVKVKYFENKKFPVVAEILGVDERTLYRWNKLVLVKLARFCKQQNWDVMFFRNQLKDEKWIMPHFQKAYDNIVKLFG